MSKFNVIALIPARGGSKRLPGKNIKNFAGKPLLAYSIDDGKISKSVNRVIVSTDDKNIAEVASKYGAEVPFLRPAEFSGDKASDVYVLAHAVDWLEKNEGYSADVVVLLRPTTPIRVDDLIDRCVNKLISNNASSVRSVRNVAHWHPYWMLKVDDDGRSEEFLDGKSVDVYYQSQLLPDLYKHDGYCDVFWRKNLSSNPPKDAPLSEMYGKERMVEINDVGGFFNIDTEDEFKLAELAYANGLI